MPKPDRLFDILSGCASCKHYGVVFLFLTTPSRAQFAYVANADSGNISEAQSEASRFLP